MRYNLVVVLARILVLILALVFAVNLAAAFILVLAVNLVNYKKAGANGNIIIFKNTYTITALVY